MTEEEIMIRAREAAITIYANREHDPMCVSEPRASEDKRLRAGDLDEHYAVRGAAQALRDLSRPLSEIQPVDPDLVEARRMCAEDALKTSHVTYQFVTYSPEDARAAILAGRMDGFVGVEGRLAAIKRGRELERQS